MAAEKRLIDANALYQTMESNLYWGQDSDGAILDTINEAPTVDAVEVAHGRWDVDVGMNYNKERICHVCNKRIESNFWNYCSHCGADMRKMEDGKECK